MSEQVNQNDDQLEEKLLALEDNPDAITDITVHNLHRDIETLAGDLKHPCPENPYAEEPACVMAIQQASKFVFNGPRLKSAVDLHAGEMVGQYEIQQKLGEGGMGVVYQASHTRLEKTVALKILPSTRNASADAIARFQREVKAVGKIDHPHLVQALDAGESESGHYLVMEHLNGRDLSQLSDLEGPLPEGVACELIRQAGVGLQVAHERGMIHRDLKPANLMLVRQEFGPPIVKVLDLGLALLAEENDAESKEGLTSVGQIMGTLDYMAPEQADDSHDVDGRTDIYSLGATLFVLLTGQSPWSQWEGRSILQKLSSLATDEITSIQTLRPDLSEELISLLGRMIAKDKNERFENMEALLAAITPLADDTDVPALLDKPALATSVFGDSAGLSKTQMEILPPRSVQTSQPQTSVSRRSIFLLLTLVILLPLTVLYAGTVFRFATDQGELVIEVDDPKVEVKIVQNGLVVQEKTQQREFTLKAKSGQIEVHETNGVRLTTKEFQLKRGEKTIVRISLEEPKATKPTVNRPRKEEPKPTPQSPDRVAAEYALGVGGAVRINGQPEYLREISKLPQEKFWLTGLMILHPAKATKKVADILEGCQHLEEIIINSAWDDQILSHLSDYPNLKVVDMVNSQVSDAGLFHLKNQKGLTHLNLSFSSRVTDQGLAHLQGCTNLVSLRIAGMQVTDQGLAHFKDCRKIKFLAIEGTQVTDAGLMQLRDLKNLEWANIALTTITDKGLTHLEQADDMLDLRISGTKVTDAGIATIVKFKKLRRLDLGLPALTEKSISQLYLLPELEFLSLFQTQLNDSALEHLKKCKSLRHLSLEETTFTPEAVASLQKALPLCRILHTPRKL